MTPPEKDLKKEADKAFKLGYQKGIQASCIWFLKVVPDNIKNNYVRGKVKALQGKQNTGLTYNKIIKEGK